MSRDKYGIVYINAESDEDVFFTMGYVHAQDRLWQLELQRRLAQGRMAEIFGESALNSDVWMRTLGIYNSAKVSKEHLGNSAKISLQAYANGINAWLLSNQKLPLEFSVFGIEFENWKVEDSLAWQKLFALNLAGNYQHELLKSIALRYQSGPAFEAMFDAKRNGFPSETENQNKLPAQAVGQLIGLQSFIEKEQKIGGQYVGSNAFAISGKHTKSGAPILAGDPHLSIQIPSLWYAVSQRGEKLDSHGFSLVGLPLVIFGRNADIAWTGTNMMADVQDLVIETTNPVNSEQYLHGNKWRNFKKRTETVNVKPPPPSFLRQAYKPVEFKVRETVNGPVISDVVSGFEQAITLKWVALSEREDHTYESFLNANYASNLDEFRGAFANYVAPALNLIYADNNNNIAMLGIGKVPKRVHGDGTLPQAALGQGELWQGYIPYQEMPFIANPESGYLVNANNSNVDANYPYLISTDFAPDYRSKRISSMLRAKVEESNKFVIEDAFKIMKDEKDLSVNKLLKYLITVSPETDRQSEALRYLRDWDEVSGVDRIAPSIFYGWVRHIKKSAYPVEPISAWNQNVHDTYMSNVNSMISNAKLTQLLEKNAQWCETAESTINLIDCREVLLESLDEALDELDKLRGKNMGDWKWGELQSSLYEHTPFSKIDAIKFLFEREYAAGGATHTVNVSAGYFDKSSGYVKNFGAGFRHAIELVKGDHQYYLMNSTGQSGQVASKHYDDMLTSFKSHLMHKIDDRNLVNFFEIKLEQHSGKL